MGDLGLAEKYDKYASEEVEGGVTVGGEYTQKPRVAFIIDKTTHAIKIRLPYLGRTPLWIFPLLVSILFFQLQGVFAHIDSLLYMDSALNLYHGLGYLDINRSPVTFRGPVFPGLITIFFWLFGVSFKSAFWVVRLFFVLNIGLVYAVGARFFNRTVGLIATVLVLTSFKMHEWSSYIMLDNVMPFFILLAHLLLFLGFEKKRNLYFGLAGFVLGIACLTKEIAALFLPLPVLVWILVPAYRTQKSWRGMLIFWGTALVVLAPWFSYTYLTKYGHAEINASIAQLGFGRSTRFIPTLLPVGNYEAAPLLVVSRWLSNLWLGANNFYQDYIVAGFALGPLFLLAWGYIFCRAVFLKESRAERVLISSLVLSLPIVLVVGRFGFRGGQGFYFFLLSYLALAHLLWFIINLPQGIVRLTVIEQSQTRSFTADLRPKFSTCAVKLAFTNC